jgi:cold shock protein
MSELETGFVKFCNEKKGFGFLQRTNGGPHVFVHANDIEGGALLVAGMKVAFVEVVGRSGRKCATAVRPLEAPSTEPAPTSAWWENK